MCVIEDFENSDFGGNKLFIIEAAYEEDNLWNNLYNIFFKDEYGKPLNDEREKLRSWIVKNYSETGERVEEMCA